MKSKRRMQQNCQGDSGENNPKESSKGQEKVIE